MSDCRRARASRSRRFSRTSSNPKSSCPASPSITPPRSLSALRHSPFSSRATWPPDQDRGQPRPSASLAAPPPSRRAACSTSTIPTVRRRSRAPGSNCLGRTSRAKSPRWSRPEDQAGSGSSLPDRAVDLAHVRRDNEEGSRRVSQSRWHQWESLAARTKGRRRTGFRRVVDARYDFKSADVVVSFEGDFLHEGAGQLRHTKDFISRRKVDDPALRMNVSMSSRAPFGDRRQGRPCLPLRVAGCAARANWRLSSAWMSCVPRDSTPPRSPGSSRAKDLLSHRGTAW